MAIINGLCTLADARKSIYGDQFATAPTTLDSDIEEYIEAATPVIENITGPMLLRTETITFDGGSDAYLLPSAVKEVLSVTVDGTAVTGFTTDLTRGILRYDGGFSGDYANVLVTYTVGGAAIPSNVVLATRELVTHNWRIGRQANRQGTASAAASTPENPMGFAIPRRVYELLQANPRMAGFA